VENIREIASSKPVKVYNLSDKIYDYSHYNMVVVEYPLNLYLYQEVLACILDLFEWTQKGQYVVLHDAGMNHLIFNSYLFSGDNILLPLVYCSFMLYCGQYSNPYEAIDEFEKLTTSKVSLTPSQRRFDDFPIYHCS
jgi:hypothetical protein